MGASVIAAAEVGTLSLALFAFLAIALEVAVDKAVQRRRFRAAGIPVPDFVILDGDPDEDEAALRAFAEHVGAPPVVKASRGGYDGRGVVVSSSLDEARS